MTFVRSETKGKRRGYKGNKPSCQALSNAAVSSVSESCEAQTGEFCTASYTITLLHTCFLDAPGNRGRPRLATPAPLVRTTPKTLPCCTDRLNPQASIAGFLILQSLLLGRGTEPKTERMSDEARPSEGRSKKRSIC